MSHERINSQEAAKVETETLTSEQMKQLLSKEGVRDQRLAAGSEGGVFKYFSPNEIDNIFSRTKKYFPMIRVGNLVVGLSELEEDPRNEGNLWLKFISIDLQYQERGYASELLKEIFSFVQKSGCTLQVSTYSEEGEIKLRPKIESLAEEYGVQLVPNR